MKKLLIIALLGLGGCQAWSVISGLSVTPQAAVVTINTFDALETIATGYLQLPACVKNGSVVCRNPAAVQSIVPAVKAGRVSRDEILTLLQQNQGNAVPVANINTLEAIINTLQSVYAQYNVQKQ
jgi:hypothetical protein